MEQPIDAPLRRAVAGYLKGESATLGTLAAINKIDPAALHRWWHKKSDIRVSTATSLASYFGLELQPARRRKK